MSDFDTKIALGVALFLNVMLFFAQLGIDDISALAGATPTNYFNYEDSMLSKYDEGGYQLKEFDPNELPDSEGGVTTEGGFFTDVFSTIKNWFLSIPGAKYVVGMVNAVPNFFKALGLPPEISFALGFIWYVMVIFLLVMSLKS